MNSADHELDRRLDQIGDDTSTLRRQRVLLYAAGVLMPAAAAAPVVAGWASAAFVAVGATGVVLPLGGLAGRGGPLAVARARRERNAALRDAIARTDDVRARGLITHGARLEANPAKRVRWLVQQVEPLLSDPRLRSAIDRVWFELQQILPFQPELGIMVVDRLAAVGDTHTDPESRAELLNVLQHAGIDANSSAGHTAYHLGQRWRAETPSLSDAPFVPSASIEPVVAVAPPPVRRTMAPPAHTVGEAIAKMLDHAGADGLIAVGELRALADANTTNARELVDAAAAAYDTLRNEQGRAGDAKVFASVVVHALETLAAAEAKNTAPYASLAADWRRLAALPVAQSHTRSPRVGR